MVSDGAEFYVLASINSAGSYLDGRHIYLVIDPSGTIFHMETIDWGASANAVTTDFTHLVVKDGKLFSAGQMQSYYNSNINHGALSNKHGFINSRSTDLGNQNNDEFVTLSSLPELVAGTHNTQYSSTFRDVLSQSYTTNLLQLILA